MNIKKLIALLLICMLWCGNTYASVPERRTLIGDISYNHGAGPRTGPNTVSFELKRMGDIYSNQVLDIEVLVSPAPYTEEYVKGRSKIVLTRGHAERTVNMGNLFLSSLGKELKTTVNIYENGVLLISATHSGMVTERTAQPGDIVYQPVGGGKYIYFNNPEIITEENLLDPDLGNVRLMEVNDLTGEYVFYAVFTNTASLLSFYTDVEFFNPNDQPACIEVERIGVKTTDYKAPEDYLSAGYNSTSAWLDFLDLSITGTEDGNYENSNYIENPQRSADFYQCYSPKRYRTTVELAPNEGKWLLEPMGLRKKLETYYGPDMTPTAYALVMKFRVTEGSPTLNLAAFHHPDATKTIRHSKVQDYVYESRGKFGTKAQKQAYWNWFITRADGKYFFEFYDHFTAMRHLVVNDPKFLEGQPFREFIPDIKTPDDLWEDGWQLFTNSEQQYLQVNGVADTLPEVHSDILFVADDSIEAGQRLKTRIYNQYYPDGSEGDSWVTSFNPQRNEYSAFLTTESDMLRFDFADSKQDWYFDVFHTSAQIAARQLGYPTELTNQNNYSVSYPHSANDTCNLQNYGVITGHDITIQNNSDAKRTFSYNLSTNAGVIVLYDLHDGKGERVLLKTTIYDTSDPEIGRKKTQEIFTFDVPANGQKTITVKTLLTNLDVGAFEHFVEVEN
ncbi:MAG: hypothetical protein E7409_00470 [Ruminococcaceae bacterium]|nr:hypothetical protein [Oscillospiraceae bacterium]